MGNRIKLIIGVVIFSALIVAAVAGSILSERVPLNDTTVVGNAPGNILNGGYFCELDGTVYFSNAEQSHALYSMNPDETKIKRLGSIGVRYIVGAGKFLYFYMDSSESSGEKGLGYVGNSYGIYRCKISDDKTTSLERARVQQMQLCGSYLYFMGDADKEGPGTYKLRIDKKERSRISGDLISTAGYDGRYIYHGGASGDPSLYYMNTTFNDIESTVLDGNISSPIPTENYIFYIDNAADYRICRLNRRTGEIDRIGTERVDCFNTNGIYVWYAVSAEGTPAIKRMIPYK